MKKQVLCPNTVTSPLCKNEELHVKMKLIFKNIVCFILAFMLSIFQLSDQGMNEVNAANSLRLNTTEIIIEQGNTFSLSIMNGEDCEITWTSENTDVAKVDEDGVVTAIDKGNTNIVVYVERFGSSNKEQFICEVGVKTSDFLPNTPSNYSYLGGKDMEAGQYVVFSDNTSSLGAFWEINNVTGNKTIDNDFTLDATIITVERSQRLVIHRGYAIPRNKVSESMLRLYNLSEIGFLQRIK